MNETLETICMIAQGLVSFATFLAIAIKPIRYKILGITKRKQCAEDEAATTKESIKCLLRSEIIKIYYKHCRDGEIKEYAFENLSLLYKAYKKLGGNSFIDKIWDEANDWKIIS